MKVAKESGKFWFMVHIIVIIIHIISSQVINTRCHQAYNLIHHPCFSNTSFHRPAEIHPPLALLVIYFVKFDFPSLCVKANKPWVCRSVFVSCAWQRIKGLLKI